MFSRAFFLQRVTASALLGSCARSSSIHPRVVASCLQRQAPSHASRSFSLAQALRQEARNEVDALKTRGPALRIPSGSVYISNVPFSVTAEQLQEAFSQFGRVRAIRPLNSQQGVFRGAAFVEFETAQEAAAFVEADQQDPIFLLERDLFVQHADIDIKPNRAPSDTLIAQHFDVGAEDLIRDIFAEYADLLVDVRIPDLKHTTGMAFIQFRSIQAATSALHALHAKMLPETGRLLRLQYSHPRTGLASRLSQRQKADGEGIGY
ncbi:hypothetical protein V8B97DRAFT_2104189 [Scleroderma yunnanense]